MKLTQSIYPLVIASILGLAASGCKTTPPQKVQLPESTTGTHKLADDKGNGLGSEIKPEEIGIGQPHPDKYRGAKDDKIFAAYMVQFDYDSPTVKSSEKSKVAYVADYLKANAANGVEVNGHCDERGTDQYNYSLGERRALAAREELIRMGIEPDRILTTSYGRSRPIDTEHNESARAKNRRDQFVLLNP